jgi:hypothetical protein
MKMMLLALVVCACMAGYGQTSGGGGGSSGGGGGSAGSGTGGSGSSRSSGAGPAPSSGSPAVNTVGSPQNQYQSGTGAGSGVQSGAAVGSGTIPQGLPGSPVNPGLPGSPTAQGLPGSQVNRGLPGFTNSMGGAGQGTNALQAGSGTNQLGRQTYNSGEVEQSLASLRGEIQQALAIIDSYNRSLLLRGSMGDSGTATGSGAPLGSAGTGANLSSRNSRDFSQNLSANSGVNASTPVGGGIVAGGAGTGAGSAIGASTSHAMRIAGAAGYPQNTTTEGQAQPESVRSLLLLQADLERTLNLLGSISVPELTSGAGAGESPQGTITGSGARVDHFLKPATPSNLGISPGTNAAGGASAGASSTR